MVAPLDEEAFSELVADALDELPPALHALLDNVVVQVEDTHETEPDLLGLYEGVPLTERFDAPFDLPDRIAVYRLPLCAEAGDLAELRHEVRVTVLHELAHRAGIEEERLHELGWG